MRYGYSCAHSRSNRLQTQKVQKITSQKTYKSFENELHLSRRRSRFAHCRSPLSVRSRHFRGVRVVTRDFFGSQLEVVEGRLDKICENRLSNGRDYKAGRGSRGCDHSRDLSVTMQSCFEKGKTQVEIESDWSASQPGSMGAKQNTPIFQGLSPRRLAIRMKEKLPGHVARPSNRGNGCF